MLPIERAQAISRAQRALKALNEHPDTSRRQLGRAREKLNDCYNLKDAQKVWQSVAEAENTAARVHGVPRTDEQRDLGAPSEPEASRPAGFQPPAAPREQRCVAAAPAGSGPRI